jgi:3-phenylpropionate/trans-cinnamate dioxygenase ferredoxin subunit
MKWVKVFNNLASAVQAIPNKSVKLVVIGSTRICLSNIENHFLAVADACPHSGQSLSQGKVNYLNEIVCPLHGYRFNLTHGREGDQKCKDATTYQVKMDKNGLHLLV